MRYLVTGACGFIGFRAVEQLLSAGHHVVGVDNLNDAYDVRLKQWRRQRLIEHSAFTLLQQDICDRPAMRQLFSQFGPFDGVINLAARAGVRQSLLDPWVYVDTNCTGTLNLSVSMARLQEFSWPGNIRQLENVVEHSAILCDERLLEVPLELIVERRPMAVSGTISKLDAALQGNEQQMIEQALHETDGRVSGPSGAAARLGVPASTLESKIKRFRIDKMRYRGWRL